MEKIPFLLKHQMSRFFAALFSLIFFSFLADEANAQELDVPYVPTPGNVVEKMLEMADVGPGDYVIDLGSGDGRIVIAAAKRGAYGHGIDIDPKRIKEARENARKAEVEGKVLFVQEDIFKTDFSRANVITMYLLNSVNLQLRSSLLTRLKPGTRVVSHDFDMNDWKPDNYVREETSNIYFWLIPAQVKGQWRWKTGNETFVMTAKQNYQEIRLQIKTGKNVLTVDEAKMHGDRISFTATHPKSDEKYIFSGRVEENTITGIVQIRSGSNESTENWNALMN